MLSLMCCCSSASIAKPNSKKLSNDLLVIDAYTSPHAATVLHKGKPLKNVRRKQRMTLQEAIFIALRKNPDVRNAQIDRVMQKYSLQQAEQNFAWRYDLDGSMTYFHKETNITKPENSATYSIHSQASKQFKSGTKISVDVQANSDGEGYIPSATLRLSQPLIRGRSSDIVLMGLAQAHDQEWLNKITLRKTISQIINQVIIDYRQLILANNNLAIAKKSLKDAEKTLANNQMQIRLGKIPRMENVTQEAQVASLKLQVKQTENTRHRSEQQLLLTLGLETEQHIDLPSDVTLQKVKIPDMTATIKHALRFNPDFLSARISRKQNVRALDKAIDDGRIQLDLSASAQISRAVVPRPAQQSPQLLNDTHHSETVGLQMKVPLERLLIRANIAGAEVALEKKDNNIEQQRRRLVRDVKDIITDLHSQRQQLELAQLSVKLKQQDYFLQKKKLQLGKGTAMDVSQSQNNLITAQNQLISNKIQFMNTFTKLSLMLDTLLDDWEIDLSY